MTYVRATDGVRIHYRVTGRPGAPPILFVQGLGADKHGWDLQRLASAPWYQAVALDNRGAGRSDKPHGEYSLEQMAQDAITVLDHAGVEKAHVVGASMGGAISQTPNEFARSRSPALRASTIPGARTCCRVGATRRSATGSGPWAKKLPAGSSARDRSAGCSLQWAGLGHLRWVGHRMHSRRRSTPS